VTPPTPDLVARLRAAGCVYAEDEAELLTAAADGPDLERLVTRRVAGEPLEQVLGWVDFAGLRLAVGPGAFVPRRRSELLVRAARGGLLPGDRVVELCCGVAAVSAALLDAEPCLDLTASDIDPSPLVWARDNIAGRGIVRRGDLYSAVPASWRRSVAVIVANAPYVPTAEVGHMPSEARDHEPLVALDGGEDGLDPARRIAHEASEWLTPGGRVIIETSQRQSELLTRIMHRAGLVAEILRDDELDATAVVGRAG